MNAPRAQHAPVLLALALLALPSGCGARGAGEAGPDAQTHAAGAPAAAAPGCSLYARDAQLDVSFAESPRAEAEYDTGYFERAIRVTRHEHGAHRRIDRWTSVLHFDAERSSGALHLETVVPWAFAGLEGARLRWQNHRRPTVCDEGEHAEPVLVAEDVLRDERGALLFLGASAPTRAGGAVLLDGALAPEVEVRWVDAGCAEAEAPGGDRARPVALRLTAGQEAWTAPVGARTAIRLGGQPYEVAVSTASIGEGGRCETAAFMIYRRDILTRRDPRQ